MRTQICKHGIKSKSNCRECRNAYARAYSNKPKVKAHRKAYCKAYNKRPEVRARINARARYRQQRTADKEFELSFTNHRIKFLASNLVKMRRQFQHGLRLKHYSNATLGDIAFRIDNTAEELQNTIYLKESIEKQIEMIRHGQKREGL